MHLVYRLRVLLGLSIAAVFLSSFNAWAQPAAQNVHKEIRAARVDNGAIKVDGVLDDAGWGKAQFVSDFLQKNPEEGARPTDSLRVAIMYDDHAVYVGARMFSAHPERLRMHLDRRDIEGPAEQLIVMLDTWHNHRTAYAFGINPAGVRFDRFHPEDNVGPMDFSYNAVWAAKTSRDPDGWSAEMRIPFSQLRFNNQDELVWGVNFDHWIPERQEDVFWIYTPRNEVRYASRFGHLSGISGVKPTRRLELLPYGTTNGHFSKVDEGDPFHDDREVKADAGGDLKMGLGPNLTLDATFNPDFGQVEADPAEVNLSAYETFFPEKRPFFLEGSELFAIDGPQYFYSRRIGQAPRGGVDGHFVDQPTSTTILGAGKVTGRLSSGTLIGVLSAVTQREYGRGYDTTTKATSKTEVEPATLNNVLRVQQEFGSEGSTVGIMLTGLHRDLKDGNPLADRLRKEAVTGGVDWNLRMKDGMYEITGYTGFSHVRGDTAAIIRTQESSTHYFQRPDQDHVKFNPHATSMTGFVYNLEAFKRSGKHWLWSASFTAETPALELNDAGILNAADDIEAWGEIKYRETEPGKTFRAYEFLFGGADSWNFDGIRQFRELWLETQLTWLNYWQTAVSYAVEFGGQDDATTRGGPLMRKEAGWELNAGVNSNFGNTTNYSLSGGYERYHLNGWEVHAQAGFSTRIGNRSQISLSPGYMVEITPRQYITTIGDAGGGERTFGKRYVFSRIDRTELSLQTRLNYFFTPDVSLEIYAEPFSASGRFYGFGELARARESDLRLYGTDGGTTIARNEEGDLVVTDWPNSFIISKYDTEDFGYRSFRSNAVLRWEFHPGSTLYLVWQRNLEGNEDVGRRVRPKSLFDSFGLTGRDFIALKISYWIPVS